MTPREAIGALRLVADALPPDDMINRIRLSQVAEDLKKLPDVVEEVVEAVEARPVLRLVTESEASRAAFLAAQNQFPVKP